MFIYTVDIRRSKTVKKVNIFFYVLKLIYINCLFIVSFHAMRAGWFS